MNPPDPSPNNILFRRRIEFHPVKKPFKGFSNDFHLETLNPTASEPRPPCSSPAASPAASKKHDGSELSDYGLDPELSFGITCRRIGAGLQNLGNTCFINSVLQCLTYTEPLAAYLQSGKHKNSCHIAGFCALCAIQNHVSCALKSTGRILSPEDLVGNLRCISQNFRKARQEDAHEYMVNLLESMHKCCLPSGVPSESPGAYEKSFVHKIFGGRLRSQVKCQQCSYGSNKFDPFLDLSLEIFKADSLQKALSNFTAAEWLDGGEKQYHCQRCKQKVRALKQLTIHEAPNVLAIHLKRFYAHDPGQKIKKKVQFGCELNLKPFVSGSYEGDVKYSLYGVLVHSGSSTHSGHYYCYVRTSNNMWYTLDDNQVNHVSERKVLNQQAYMLFYVRDRKSIIPRKPVDIVKKDNMKANVNGNRDSSTSNHILVDVPNGTVENKLWGEPSMTAEAEKNMSNVDSSRVSFLKDTLVQKKNSVMLAENLMQGKIPVAELSPKAQQPVDSPEGLSAAKPELECMSSLDHSRKDYTVPSNLQSSVAPSGCKIDMCNENEISKEGMKDSLAIVPTFNNPQISTGKHANDGTSYSLEKKIVAKVDVAAPQDSMSNGTSSITSLIPLNNVNHQVGSSATSSVCDKAGGIVCENAVGSQGLVLHDSVNGSLNMESLNQKCMKKSKKKFLKYQVSSMHARSTFLFLAYLSPRKKRNHKRSKRRTSGLKNPIKGKLDKHDFSSDVGPSTAGKVDEFPCVSSCFLAYSSPRKKRNHKRSKRRTSGLKNPIKGKLDKHDFSSDVGPSTAGKVDEFPCVSSCFESRETKAGYKAGANFKSNNESPVENTAEEFRKRINQNCAILATAMQLENISGCGSVVDQFEARQADSLQDGKRDQMHNSLMSMLTRGLEETVVASWDDIELHSSQSLESKNDQIVSIGYVGDEWDEEYDKGKRKRKKIRGSKHSFSGPNLFQEIATEKSKFKRVKLDQSSSGNPPFRMSVGFL